MLYLIAAVVLVGVLCAAEHRHRPAGRVVPLLRRPPWVLRGVDLHIPHGRATALVGLNGAGKSTLVKLLCRLYDATRGTILWDGADLRDLDVAELRQRVGAVFQDYMECDMKAAESVAVGVNGRGQEPRDASARAGTAQAAVPPGSRPRWSATRR